MRELVQTNDPVLVSFIEVLLRRQGIEPFVFDSNMSIMEGSIGILPRRILVANENWEPARRLLEEADLGHWISERGKKDA